MLPQKKPLHILITGFYRKHFGERVKRLTPLEADSERQRLRRLAEKRKLDELDGQLYLLLIDNQYI